MLDSADPQIWWFLTRASAIVAWVLLTLTAVWGILLKTRILRGADNPEWLKVTHRYISGLAISMVIVHIVTLVLDEYVDFTWRELFIPFTSVFEPLGVALGVIAVWLLVAIQGTALLARWLPERLWKVIHLSSYGVLVLVGLHSGLVGTDVGTPWYTVVSLILITTATLAAVVRFIIAGRERPVARVSAPLVEKKIVPGKVDETFLARVVERQDIGAHIAVYTLAPVDSGVSLEWDAGSHVTLHLGNGLQRQYSLAGDPAEQDVLVIGVRNTRGEGGGSKWIHENLHAGDEILCGLPRNHFPLKPARNYQFIASGIGITPIRSMLHTLPASRQWSLLYIARAAEDMVFADELVRDYGDKVTLWATGERGGRPPLANLIEGDSEVYACGSSQLLDELERIVPPHQFHSERFEPKIRVSHVGGSPFTVVAARSGVSQEVTGATTILDALAQEGIQLQGSCLRGVCGSCEVKVLEGVPEHLDSVMSDEDKDDLAIMYPCVSRSKTPTLVLDV